MSARRAPWWALRRWWDRPGAAAEVVARLATNQSYDWANISSLEYRGFQPIASRPDTSKWNALWYVR